MVDNRAGAECNTRRVLRLDRAQWCAIGAAGERFSSKARLTGMDANIFLIQVLTPAFRSGLEAAKFSNTATTLFRANRFPE